MHIMNTRILASAAGVALALGVASQADASLLGTSMNITITHTGISGGLVGPAFVPHTYGGAPSIFNNQFFGSFLIASPTVAPGYDNAILVDFSLFNYSGFIGGNMGTIAIASIDEDVAAGSVAIFAGASGMGPNIAVGATSNGSSLSASWSTDLIYTADATPDAMVVAWNSAPVPAPGALALLGAAGLVGLRRRRKA